MKIPNKVILLDKRNLSNEEWVEKRNSYIGGSDVGTILGLNSFESPLECFHRKCHVIPSSKPESLSTLSGHIMEPVIYKEYWRFYDPENPSNERLVENHVANRVIRTAKRKNFTMIHPEYTWLGCNVDWIIDASEYNPKGGVLDAKNSLQWVSKQYIGNVNPHYVCQMMSSMIITGFDYSELCYLLDGRFPEVFPINESADLQSKIIAETKRFYEMILEGRKIWQSSDSESVRLQNLSQIEPEVDGSKALEDYLKERFKLTGKMGKLTGDAEILEFGKKYLECNEKLSAIDTDKKLYGNMLRKIFIDSGVDEITYQVPDKSGILVTKPLISYRVVESGKSPSLRVSKDLERVV